MNKRIKSTRARRRLKLRLEETRRKLQDTTTHGLDPEELREEEEDLLGALQMLDEERRGGEPVEDMTLAELKAEAASIESRLSLLPLRLRKIMERIARFPEERPREEAADAGRPSSAPTSRRDLFAAAALSGLSARRRLDDPSQKGQVARLAWEMADRMIVWEGDRS